MANLIATLEPVSAPTTSRTHLRLLIRTQRRKLLVKALRTLQALVRADDREAARAARQGWTPLLIRGANNSKEDRAIKTCIENFGELLAAKG